MGERECKFRFWKKNAVIVFLNVICIFVKHYLSGRVVLYVYIYLKNTKYI